MKLGNIPKDGKIHGHAPMYPPPVPFKKTEKTQKPITKDEYKTVTLKIDPSDEAKDSPTIDKKSDYSQMEQRKTGSAGAWNGKMSYVTNPSKPVHNM